MSGFKSGGPKGPGPLAAAHAAAAGKPAPAQNGAPKAGPATPAAAGAQDQSPQSAPLTVTVQYVKDLSFEIPEAPSIFTTLKSSPEVAINLDVQAQKLEGPEGTYEVRFVSRVEARETGQGAGQTSGRIVFIAELTYCGVFVLSGIPAEQVEPVLLIECPRLLFPFARNIIASVTSDAGFPPVMLQPIDFVGLWHSRQAQQPAPGHA